MPKKRIVGTFLSILTLAAVLGFAPGRAARPGPPVLDEPTSPVLDPSVVITATLDAANTDSLFLYRVSGADTAVYRSKVAAVAFRDTILLLAGPNEIWAVARDTSGEQSTRSNTVFITYNKINARIFPEVFRAPGNFEIFTVQTAFEVTVDLFTLDGERVVHLRRAGPSNVFRIAWNLTNGDGNSVRNGPYLAMIKITDSRGLTVEKHFIAVVR
jgi:hypothetical protein